MKYFNFIMYMDTFKLCLLLFFFNLVTKDVRRKKVKIKNKINK